MGTKKSNQTAGRISKAKRTTKAGKELIGLIKELANMAWGFASDVNEHKLNKVHRENHEARLQLLALAEKDLEKLPLRYVKY